MQTLATQKLLIFFPITIYTYIPTHSPLWNQFFFSSSDLEQNTTSGSKNLVPFSSFWLPQFWIHPHWSSTSIPPAHFISKRIWKLLPRWCFRQQTASMNGRRSISPPSFSHYRFCLKQKHQQEEYFNSAKDEIQKGLQLSNHMRHENCSNVHSSLTLGSNCICHTSEGGASRVAIVALVSTSKTRTKLSSDAEAAMMPDGWAATATTPRQWPVLVCCRTSSSGFQSFTVSSREPVRRRAGRESVAGTQAAAHIDSSCAFSTDLRPASFMACWVLEFWTKP